MAALSQATKRVCQDQGLHQAAALYTPPPNSSAESAMGSVLGTGNPRLRRHGRHRQHQRMLHQLTLNGPEPMPAAAAQPRTERKPAHITIIEWAERTQTATQRECDMVNHGDNIMSRIFTQEELFEEYGITPSATQPAIMQTLVAALRQDQQHRKPHPNRTDVLINTQQFAVADELEHTAADCLPASHEQLFLRMPWQQRVEATDQLVPMRPCKNGSGCIARVFLRTSWCPPEIMTPQEFEELCKTGAYPRDNPAECVLCMRSSVYEASHLLSHKVPTARVHFDPPYCNLVDVDDGYKREYCLQPGAPIGLFVPLVYPHLNVLRVRLATASEYVDVTETRPENAEIIDQSEIMFFRERRSDPARTTGPWGRGVVLFPKNGGTMGTLRLNLTDDQKGSVWTGHAMLDALIHRVCDPEVQYALYICADSFVFRPYGRDALSEDDLPDFVPLLPLLALWQETDHWDPMVHILSKVLPQRCLIREVAAVCLRYIRDSPIISTTMLALIYTSLLGNYRRNKIRLPIEFRVLLIQFVERIGVEYFASHWSCIMFYALREFLVYTVWHDPALTMALRKVYDWLHMEWYTDGGCDYMRREMNQFLENIIRPQRPQPDRRRAKKLYDDEDGGDVLEGATNPTDADDAEPALVGRPVMEEDIARCLDHVDAELNTYRKRYKPCDYRPRRRPWDVAVLHWLRRRIVEDPAAVTGNEQPQSKSVEPASVAADILLRPRHPDDEVDFVLEAWSECGELGRNLIMDPRWLRRLGCDYVTYRAVHDAMIKYHTSQTDTDLNKSLQGVDNHTAYILGRIAARRLLQHSVEVIPLPVSWYDLQRTALERRVRTHGVEHAGVLYVCPYCRSVHGHVYDPLDPRDLTTAYGACKVMLVMDIAGSRIDRLLCGGRNAQVHGGAHTSCYGTKELAPINLLGCALRFFGQTIVLCTACGIPTYYYPWRRHGAGYECGACRPGALPDDIDTNPINRLPLMVGTEDEKRRANRRTIGVRRKLAFQTRAAQKTKPKERICDVCKIKIKMRTLQTHKMADGELTLCRMHNGRHYRLGIEDAATTCAEALQQIDSAIVHEMSSARRTTDRIVSIANHKGKRAQFARKVRSDRVKMMRASSVYGRILSGMDRRNRQHALDTMVGRAVLTERDVEADDMDDGHGTA